MGSFLSTMSGASEEHITPVEIGLRAVMSIANGINEKELRFKLSDVISLRVAGEKREFCGSISKVISKLPNLRRVVIIRIGMREEDVERIVSELRMHWLEYLDLSGNDISKNTAVTIRRMMASGRVEKIFLQNCNLDACKLRNLLQGLREGKNQVKVLDIMENRIEKRIYEPNKDLFESDKVVWDRKLSQRQPLHKIGRTVTKFASEMVSL